MPFGRALRFCSSKVPERLRSRGGFFVKHLILTFSLTGAPDYLQWNKIDYLAFIYNFDVINSFYNIYVMLLRWVKYLILTTGDYSLREIMR